MINVQLKQNDQRPLIQTKKGKSILQTRCFSFDVWFISLCQSNKQTIVLPSAAASLVKTIDSPHCMLVRPAHILLGSHSLYQASELNNKKYNKIIYTIYYNKKVIPSD